MSRSVAARRTLLLPAFLHSYKDSSMPETTEPLERVMVVAAHPDDPEFGCAGTVVKWAQAGRHITYLLLTSGDKGSHDPDLRPGRLAARREEEQRAAARELGVRETIFLRHPDGLLENTLELRRELCALIRHVRPQIILAIDPWRHYQLHPDHRAAGQAALDAIYAAREWNIFPEQLVESEEPWRVKEAYLFWTGEPDYWEDISCCMDARIAALARHASQVGEDTTQLAERIRARAHEAGEKPGYDFAEAFRHFQF
jgi:LmbE family N-acetylglucosaminyl deacetylase